MIRDIIIYINDLWKLNHEVIILIDNNENFISSDCGFVYLPQQIL